MADWPILSGANYHDVMGSVPASSSIAVLTAGAANVKGAYVQLSAATPSEYCGLLVQYSAVSAANKVSIDLAIGPGGSEIVIVPDLLTWETRILTTVWIPIAVPAGVRLAARCQSSTASNTARVSVQGIPTTPRMPQGYMECTNYGFVAASTTGLLFDAGGTANTDVIQDLTASTTREIRCLYLMQTQGSGSPGANLDLLLDVGTWDGTNAASWVSFADDLYFRVVTAAYTTPYIVGPFFGNIPLGTRLSVRGRASATDATGRTLNLAALGLN